MHLYKRNIRMQDTDATRVIYFAEQLKIALEAFENFLESKNFSLHSMILKEEFLLPIVHAEANYFSPLFLGDEIEIHLFLKHMGTTSFRLRSDFFKNEKKVGDAEIVHVAISPLDHQPISIPQVLLDVLFLL